MKALITITAFTFFLVACGGESGSSAESTPASAPVPETPGDKPDTDGDGTPDDQDDDIDGDGVLNSVDSFEFDASEWADNDRDGIGDNADTDDDNDGFSDSVERDLFTDPMDAESSPQDTDNDGIPDALDPDSDNDGMPDEADRFPLDPNEQADNDGDGLGDNIDPDDDNDGYPDSLELVAGTDPLDADSHPVDLDGDGEPDTTDDDIDGDGYLNGNDDLPRDPSEWSDTDGDSIGDNADTDDDGDGYRDSDEIAAGTDPLDPSDLPADLDGDFVPDSLDTDIDGDGVNNDEDVFPYDASEILDTDNDGVGNNADTDDDGDGYSDSTEVLVGSDPLDAESVPDDLDNDGIPDLQDDDIDGDGVLNVDDAYPRDPTRSEPPVVTEPSPLDTELLNLIAQVGFDPTELTERILPQPDDPLVELGKELFFSRSLSFGDDVACASCHDPRLAGTDNLSLPVGVGAHNPMIVGPGRRHDGNFYIDPKADFGPNVPRNSPTTFNIAFYDKAMFWDGRIETIEYDSDQLFYVGVDTGVPNGEGQLMRTPDSHFRGPDAQAGPNLTAAQARFPVTSVTEMRGFSSDAGLTAYDTRDLIADKLLSRGWESYFRDAFGDYYSSSSRVITYDRIALALGEYQRSQVALDYPFADYLAGNLSAVSESAKEGALMFFNPSRGHCYSCHTGAKLSDESYYPMATPQIGRGKNIFSQDFGRYNAVPMTEKKFSFRTPSLINSELTFPYMHAGTLPTLEDAIKWHFDPVTQLSNYDFSLQHLPQFAGLGIDTSAHEAQVEAISEAYTNWKNKYAKDEQILPKMITDSEVILYAEFLRSLTSRCLLDTLCISQWLPDFDVIDPDGFRLEPEFSWFDNDELFSIEPPLPGDTTSPVFPDFSQNPDLDISDCSVNPVPDPQEIDLISGFNKIDLSGMYLRHSIGTDILRDVEGLGITALVIGSVASADLDGDCDFDVAVGLGKEKGIRVYINDNGRFRASENNFGLDSTGDIAAFSLADVNGDGWPDLLVGHVYEPEGKLWLNNAGQGFIRVTEFGHDTVRTTHNSAFADVDGDGDLDIFSSNWDFLKTAEEIHLWKNDGKGFFEPTENNGIYGAFGDRDFTFTPNFADINKDGLTDILVAADFQRSQVFQGLIEGGFSNVTDVDVITDYNAMGAAVGDIDNDMDLDWFATNIEMPYDGYEAMINKLYRNDSVVGGAIEFTDISLSSGVSQGLWAWGACMKDFDNDGWLDIFHVNGYGYGNTTFDHPLFSALSQLGIEGIFDLVGYSTESLIGMLYDYFGGFTTMNQILSLGYSSEQEFNEDVNVLIKASKELDDQLGTGSPVPELFYGTEARLFMNNHNGTFTEQASLRGINSDKEGRGVVCNDFDRDGDIDIVIMNHGSVPEYYENHFRRISNTEDNFLNLRLRGIGGNQYAYGAKVYATSASLSQYREMRFENNYMSNNAPELHFGLAGDETLSELRVEWPDGAVTILKDVSINQFLVVEHPSYTD